MRSCFVSSLICLCIFIGCETQSDRASEREILLETDKQFAALSAKAGAAEAFYQYLDSAAVQISGNSGPIHGRDNIFKIMKPTDTGYKLLWDPQFANVSRCGDMGWTWGAYMLTVAVDSSQIRGYYLNVWEKKSDGNWRVVADIGNVSSK